MDGPCPCDLRKEVPMRGCLCQIKKQLVQCFVRLWILEGIVRRWTLAGWRPCEVRLSVGLSLFLLSNALFHTLYHFLSIKFNSNRIKLLLQWTLGDNRNNVA